MSPLIAYNDVLLFRYPKVVEDITSLVPSDKSPGTHSGPSLSCVEKARVLLAVRELYRRVQTMGCLLGGKTAVA